MAEYTFTGLSDERSFVKADFDRHIEDNQQGAVRFNAKNDFTADLTDEAAAFLIEQGEPIVLTSEHKAAQKAKADAAAAADAEEAPDDADDGKASGSTAGSTAGSGAAKASGATTKASAKGTTSTT